MSGEGEVESEVIRSDQLMTASFPQPGPQEPESGEESGEASPSSGRGAPHEELDFEVDEEEEPEREGSGGEVGAGSEILDAKKEKGDEDVGDEGGEDGEVNSDEDLEEGEVKESEDDEDDGEVKEPSDRKPSGDQKAGKPSENVCKYFGKGTCTWGPQCRFTHQYPGKSTGLIQEYPL